nr:MAG TPA: Minor capsid protein [Caudoviricetes sp.]
MAIDVSEIVHDPDFCTTFTVIKQGESEWVRGVLQRKTTETTVEGIVQPSSSKDLELLDTADRVNGMKTFITDAVNLDVSDTEKTSDVCVWKGQRYKLIQTFDYAANGYYKAIGVLLGEEDSG